MTKPIVAVAALLLVEECKLRLEDPVDTLRPSSPPGRCSSTVAVLSTATPSQRAGRSRCTTS